MCVIISEAIFSSVGLYICFGISAMLFRLLQPFSIVKSGSVMPPAMFFLLRTVLAM